MTVKNLQTGHPILSASFKQQEKPLLMNNQTATVFVSPAEVIKNTCLHVKTAATHFPEKEYRINDENGRVVRKGSVNERVSEFTLSMVGIKAGVYRFIMGAVQEKFVVVW